ncbi:hypothetical protein [Roseobacter sp.]
MITDASEVVRDLMHMRHKRGGMRVEFTDVASGWAIFGLAGKRAC